MKSNSVWHSPEAAARWFRAGCARKQTGFNKSETRAQAWRVISENASWRNIPSLVGQPRVYGVGMSVAPSGRESGLRMSVAPLGLESGAGMNVAPSGRESGAGMSECYTIGKCLAQEFGPLSDSSFLLLLHLSCG